MYASRISQRFCAAKSGDECRAEPMENYTFIKYLKFQKNRFTCKKKALSLQFSINGSCMSGFQANALDLDSVALR